MRNFNYVLFKKIKTIEIIRLMAAYLVLLEDSFSFELDSAVQGRLTAEGEQDPVGTFRFDHLK